MHNLQYVELKVKVSNTVLGNEILIALLAEIGFESFVEESDGFLAYIQEDNFNQSDFEQFIYKFKPIEFTFSTTIQKVEQQNWNALWESNYSSILIDNQCYIRAPFHERRPDVSIEIIIEPKMSFGTAHHPTTAQIISFLLKENLENKKVLDMGTGTGVFAILSEIKKATYILAIDNDPWAYENCIENIQRNHCTHIDVVLGDANNVQGQDFDVVIANINRNILRQDMHKYAQILKNGGCIFLSGFYLTPDLDILTQEALKYNIFLQEHTQQDGWCAVKGIKKDEKNR